jgi:hypothetical protein
MSPKIAGAVNRSQVNCLIFSGTGYATAINLHLTGAEPVCILYFASEEDI